MYQIQLLLPLYDVNGNPFPSSYYEEVKQKLSDKFGGITMYSRTPVTGLWKPSEKKIVKDDLIIYEILSEQIEKTFWRDYKHLLQKTFNQDEIIIKSSEIHLF